MYMRLKQMEVSDLELAFGFAEEDWKKVEGQVILSILSVQYVSDDLQQSNRIDKPQPIVFHRYRKTEKFLGREIHTCTVIP